MHLFRSGLQVTTIRNYRSAIAAIHQGFADGSSISSNDAIHHLFRGMFTQRPPVKRLIPSWDLSAVLRLLAGPPFEPLSGASLLHVSIKLAFLLAVATSRRIIMNWPSPPDNKTLCSITVHDVRAVSASWAFFRGVPMEDICKPACWKTLSIFTLCYLSDVLQRDSTHGRSVLAPPPAEPRSPIMPQTGTHSA